MLDNLSIFVTFCHGSMLCFADRFVFCTERLCYFLRPLMLQLLYSKNYL